MTKKRPTSQLETIAWIGTGLILLGYGLFSIGAFPDPTPYHIMNLFGSIAVALIAHRRRDWQPFVINACFAIFALVAIGRIML